MKCFFFLNSPKQNPFPYEYTPSLCIGIGDKIKKIRREKYISDLEPRVEKSNQERRIQRKL